MKTLLLTLALFCAHAGFAQLLHDTAQIPRWQQEGAWEQVLASVQRIDNPAPRLLNAAGFAAYQTGDRAGAASWYARTLACDSNDRSALYYSGLIHKAEERAAAAIPLLQRLCRIAADNAGYQQLLGDCYAETDQHPAAADAYRRAYRIAPGAVGIVTRLATALQNSDFPEQADTLLRSAMLRHPGNPALINSAISVAYSRKQYERCASLCDSLIATGKMNYKSLLSGLYADIARPDFKHATKLGEVLIAMRASTADVLYYTAVAHQKLGNWKKADTLLRDCVTGMLRPQLNDCYHALAEGAAAQNRVTTAKAYYDTAYYLFKNPLTLYRAGRMLEERGMEAAAKPVYKKYLALPPARQDTAIARYLKNRIGENR